MLLYSLRQEKNPKFEGLKINNEGDMAILRFVKNENILQKFIDLATLRAFFHRCP